MKPIKNIIFDLGGVLISLDFAATEHAFKQIIGTTDFTQAYRDLQMENIFEDLETGHITVAHFIEKIASKAHNSATETAIIDAWNAMLITFPAKGIELIHLLRDKGYQLYVLSNTNAIHLKAFRQIVMKEHGIADFDALFDKAYYSHLVHLRKPNTSIFEFVVQDAQLDPEETLFIDDNQPNLDGAEAVGLQTLLHQQKDCIFEHLVDVLQLH